jgi:uncharacterized membrane protein
MKAKLLILIICVIILFSGITMIVFTKYKIQSTITIPMKIEVSDKIGLTTETEILNFGKARPGDDGIRRVEIKNPDNSPVTAYFFPQGDLKNWVKKEPIYLNKHESKNVTISAKIPANTEFGVYEGVLKVVFKRT